MPLFVRVASLPVLVLAVGIELVKSPKVLFLDEPTSGEPPLPPLPLPSISSPLILLFLSVGGLN
jgi:hypothetical protein